MKNDQNIEFSKSDQNRFFPSKDFQNQARINTQFQYEELYQKSIQEPENFWGEIAQEFLWKKSWNQVLCQKNSPFVKWFLGAQLNITENIIEKNLKQRANKKALIWEGENGDQCTYTYEKLAKQVHCFTHSLKEMGVRKGDCVVFYMPMIPEFLFSLLAVARLGAIHSVVFAGFSAVSLEERIKDCSAKWVITADGVSRRGKTLLLKNIVDQALENNFVVEKCVVFQRANVKHSMKKERDVYWKDIQSKSQDLSFAEVMNADDILFILYTSGSTGKPKGIQHSIAGYMVGVATSFKYIFDYQEKDIFWCTADIGWITGHSYVIYGPLLNGATLFMYEGTPDYPHFGRFWELIENHKVTTFYTAPTAIRSFMKWGDEHPQKYDLSSLRLLGTVGEAINPMTWQWFYEKIGQSRCPIVDTWWQTETGSIMISPFTWSHSDASRKCYGSFFWSKNRNCQ